jgi:dCTP deaminase
VKLADRDIIAVVRAGELIVDPWVESNVQPASLDVTLGDEWLTISETKFTKDSIILPPGGCILGRTVERFKMPNTLVGELAGRSSVGRMFIAVHVTAGYIDPGFEGTLTLEIVNLGSVDRVLTAGTRIAQVSFTRLTKPALRPYRGRYQGQVEPTASRLDLPALPHGLGQETPHQQQERLANAAKFLAATRAARPGTDSGDVPDGDGGVRPGGFRDVSDGD